MGSITSQQLEQLLRRKSRSSFISITAVTDPDMRKRYNPFCTQSGRKWIPHIRKVSILSGAIINASYQRMVNRRLLQEHVDTHGEPPPTERQTNPRAWGVQLPECPLVHHVVNGESRLYLHLVVQRRHDHFFDNRTNHRLTPDEQATLDEWLNERDAGFECQGLQNPVIVKSFTLTNVAEITANKTQYTIAPAAKELTTYLPAPPQDHAAATARRKHGVNPQLTAARGQS